MLTWNSEVEKKEKAHEEEANRLAKRIVELVREKSDLERRLEIMRVMIEGAK